jgi:hypothetical protein
MSNEADLKTLELWDEVEWYDTARAIWRTGSFLEMKPDAILVMDDAGRHHSCHLEHVTIPEETFKQFQRRLAEEVLTIRVREVIASLDGIYNRFEIGIKELKRIIDDDLKGKK